MSLIASRAGEGPPPSGNVGWGGLRRNSDFSCPSNCPAHCEVAKERPMEGAPLGR
jgi:hypothetical protein